MAAVPLLQDSSHKPSSPRVSFGRLASVLIFNLSGKDDLTVAIEKVTSPHFIQPKEKHLRIILAKVDNNPLILESVLLKFSALTQWSDYECVALQVISRTRSFSI